MKNGSIHPCERTRENIIHCGKLWEYLIKISNIMELFLHTEKVFLRFILYLDMKGMQIKSEHSKRFYLSRNPHGEYHCLYKNLNSWYWNVWKWNWNRRFVPTREYIYEQREFMRISKKVYYFFLLIIVALSLIRYLLKVKLNNGFVYFRTQ